MGKGTSRGGFEMVTMFKKCLEADYIHTENGGDYAIEVCDNILYILFECSDGEEDWRNNFKFPVKPYKDMKPVWYCHGGFLGVWKAMRDDIEAKVAQLLRENEIAEIKCIGYSHGAALAVLATEDMAYLYGDNYTISGYGYGAPRVLWGIVPNEVKERLECFKTIRNIPDIVTHLPPKLFGFRNAGEMLEIGGTDREYGLFMSHHYDNYIIELKKLTGE
jgi:hypothetical protein